MGGFSQRMGWTVLAIAAAAAVAAHPAAAQLQFSSADGESSLKLGVLGQLQGQDIDTPDGKESAKDLYFRRLRLVGQFKYGDKLSVYFDTDAPNLGKGNADGTKNVNTSIYIQDFVVTYAFAHEFQFEGGEILLAQSYNHNTSSAQLMPLDFGAFPFTETGATQGNAAPASAPQPRCYLSSCNLKYRPRPFPATPRT